MLKITLKNGEVEMYSNEEYTKWHYDGQVLAVMSDKECIGIYAVDCLVSAKTINVKAESEVE